MALDMTVVGIEILTCTPRWISAWQHDEACLDLAVQVQLAPKMQARPRKI